MEAETAPEAEALATLVHLGRRARDARDCSELHFIGANETHSLTPYRQAVLWLREGGVTTLSGVVEPEANAPYVNWLSGFMQRLDRGGGLAPAKALDQADITADDLSQWRQWLPSSGLWLDLPASGGFTGGALLLVRDDVWTPAETGLLVEWAATWSQARALLQPKPALVRLWHRLGGKPAGAGSDGWLRSRKLWFALLLPLLLLIPVRLSVLAPAELIPLNPAVIRAPLDGVVEQVLVEPNQLVQRDQPLFEFDRASVRNRLQVALQTLATVEAEYRQKAQQALFDSDSKGQLAVLQGQIAEKQTEVDFLRQLDSRGLVLAPRDGLALFDDPTEWVGRPVVTGEKVMVVAGEHQVEVEAWLSPADIIPLAAQAPLRLYLNADPLHSITANMHYLAHEASQRPEGHYAYRLRAKLRDAGSKPRVGLKGTAKLEGEKVTLFYWMLRRPLAAARTWLGI